MPIPTITHLRKFNARFQVASTESSKRNPSLRLEVGDLERFFGESHETFEAALEYQKQLGERHSTIVPVYPAYLSETQKNRPGWGSGCTIGRRVDGVQVEFTSLVPRPDLPDCKFVGYIYTWDGGTQRFELWYPIDQGWELFGPRAAYCEWSKSKDDGPYGPYRGEVAAGVLNLRVRFCGLEREHVGPCVFNRINMTGETTDDCA